jgi:hypothetical protein
LVFVGRLSEADVICIRRYHDLLVIRRPIRWAAGVVFTVLAVVGVWWTLAWGNGEWWSWLIAAWFVWVGSLPLLFLPPVRAWEARRHYRKHQANYLESKVSLGEDRLEIENQAHRSSSQWQLIGLVAETPEGLLFCTHARQVLFWLPARLLADGVPEQVLALLNRTGVLVRRLR